MNPDLLTTMIVRIWLYVRVLVCFKSGWVEKRCVSVCVDVLWCVMAVVC